MLMSIDVVSEINFLSSVVLGRRRVVLRVSREVRREVLGPGLSPFGNLAMITLVGRICRVRSSLLVWRCIVRSLFHLCSPISHRGLGV